MTVVIRRIKDMTEKLLNTKQVSAITGLSVSTLKNIRRNYEKLGEDNVGPDYIRIGSMIRYKADDVNKWINDLSPVLTKDLQKYLQVKTMAKDYVCVCIHQL